jgi:hypothetical protein
MSDSPRECPTVVTDFVGCSASVFLTAARISVADLGERERKVRHLTCKIQKNCDILRLVISESRMDLDAIIDTGEKVGIQIDFFDVETFEHGDAL